MNKSISDEFFPLSIEEETLWIDNSLLSIEARDSLVLTTSISILGECTYKDIHKVFLALIKINPILNCVYTSLDSVIMQKKDSQNFDYGEYKDISSLKAEDVDCILENSFKNRIDIEKNVIDFSYFKIADRTYKLMIYVHHIVSDHTSMVKITEQYFSLFRMLDTNVDFTTLEKKSRNKEFVLKKRENSVLSDEEEKYWKKIFSDEDFLVQLPQDNPYPNEISGFGTLLIDTIKTSTYDKLKLVLKNEEVSAYIFLASLFNILLYKLSGANRIPLFLAMNIRDDDTKDEIGYFVNSLPVICDIDTTLSLSGFLQDMKKITKEISTRRNQPFSEVNKLFNYDRTLPIHPLQKYSTTYTKYKPFSETFRDCKFIYEPVRAFGNPGVDLSMIFVDSGSDISIEFNYNKDIFSSDTGEKFLEWYMRLFQQALDKPSTSINALTLLSDNEIKGQLNSLKGPEKAYNHELTIHQLFENQVLLSPDNIAVVHGDKSITYRKLNERANQLAERLIHEGTKVDSLVALCINRSIEMIVSIYAVLKTGAAYIPIDPKYPNDRIEYMLNDSNALILLTESSFNNDLDNVNSKVLYIDTLDLNGCSKENKNVFVKSNNLVYIIYTSGSTGKPKGVMVAHRGQVNLLNWYSEEFDVNENSATLLISSLSFDLTQKNIFVTLKKGAKLVVPSSEEFDPSLYLDLIHEEKCTFINCAPSAFYALLDASDENYSKLSSLGYVFLGGESIKYDLVKSWLTKKKTILVNSYGPTECSDVVSYYMLTNINSIETTIPIGKAINNTQLYILDEKKVLVPKGVPGELYISGDGLARGYYHQEEMTNDRFIDNPFIENKKMYKTGDIVRSLKDGNIEYLHRSDDQVKIRGYRIELGEIENQLLAIDEIKEAVVLVKENGMLSNLVAFIVLKEELPEEKIKTKLSASLIEYMVPNIIVSLESIPLTPNGKIDKKALLKIDVEFKSLNEYIEAKNDIERKLIKMFSALLHVDKIGANDDFFELGGHSLLSTRLVSLIQSEWSIKLPLKDLFKHSKVSTLAYYIELKLEDKLEIEDKLVIMRAVGKEYDKFPLNTIQQAYYIGRNSGQVLGNTASYGYEEIEINDIDIERLEIAWNKIIDRHEMLRCIFHDDLTQSILESVPYTKIVKADYSNLTEEETSIKLFKERELKLSHVADPSKWPLITMDIYILSDKKAIIHFFKDTLVCDGSSTSILFSDLIYYYNNPDVLLPELTIGFKDYIEFEEKYKTSQSYLNSLNYWDKRLDTLPSGPQLPLLRSPSLIEKPQFIGKKYYLEKSRWKTFQKKALTLKITPSVLLLTLYAKVIAIYSHTEHFSLTLTQQNRIQVDERIDSIIGEFTSLILFEVDIKATQTIGEILNDVQIRLLDDIDNRAVDGIEVLRKLRSNNNESSMPVVFTSVLGINQDEKSWLGKTTYQLSQTPQVWLDNQVYEQDNELVVYWSYLKELFSEEMISDMFLLYEKLINNFIDNNEFLNKNNINFLSNRELENRKKYNQPEMILNKEIIPFQFMKTAFDKPNNKAIITSKKDITYRQLHNASSQIAQFIDSKELDDNAHVAIILPKSYLQVIAVMGCGYAGKAYLPIAVDTPIKRIQLILKQAKVSLVLCENKDVEKLSLFENIEIKDITTIINFEKNISSYKIKAQEKQLAYTIFTSGSTGVPKGVMITHENVTNTIMDINQRFNITSEDRIFAISALNFDLSVYDIYGALSSGAAIVMPSEEYSKSPQQWLRLVIKKKVTVWNSVPAIIGLLSDEVEEENIQLLSSLRLILMSGDFIPINLIKKLKRLSPDCELISLGGATEASIWSIYYPIKDINIDRVPYGYPLANQELYILDKSYQMRPDHVHGEIFIKGKGVAKGYLNDMDKTKSQFIENKIDDSILYKTGDIGYFNSKGYIEIVGRSDNQVKIQGYRVELGEIENHLLAIDGIEEAVVLAKKDSSNHIVLVAYVMCELEIGEENIKTELLKTLPQYMIPNTFIGLENVPLTANGKIDRNYLNQLEVKVESTRKYVEPKNQIETSLVLIFSEVLKIEKVGIYDDFFELGGTSLSGIKLISEISHTFNVELGLATLFQASNVYNLVKAIREEENFFDILVPIKEKGNKTPIFAIPGTGGLGLEFQYIAKILGEEHPFYALQSSGFDGKTDLVQSIEEIALNNIKIIKNKFPNPPYNFIGYSFGGIVVYEMMKLLEKEERGFVIFLDAYSPTIKNSIYEKIKKNTVPYLKRIYLFEVLIYVFHKLIKKEKKVILADNKIFDEIRKNNIVCAEKYIVKKMKIDLGAFLLQAKEDADTYLYNGWDELIDIENIIKYNIKGNHISILDKSNAIELSKVIQICIDVYYERI